MTKITVKKAIKVAETNEAHKGFPGYDEDILLEFGLTWHEVFINYDLVDERLCYRFFDTWLCTDRWVGGSVLYFDNIAVAIVTQAGRKCSCNYHWISKKRFNKVREFFEGMVQEKNLSPIFVTLKDEIEV